MNIRPPSLRLHASKRRYYCRWGGRFFWLGTDEARARTQFDEHLVRWAEWRRDREMLRQTLQVREAVPFQQLFERFISAKVLETSRHTVSHYRCSLKRFVSVFGAVRADLFRSRHLQEFREGLGKYSPKTINHNIAAVKAMIQWAVDQELIPAVSLRGVKPLRVPPPKRKGYTIQEVRRFIKQGGRELGPWIALQWGTCMRPFEVPRVVRGDGEWVETGVIRLWNAKTQNRHVILSPWALRQLKECEPVYGDGQAYQHAFLRTLGAIGGPHPIRHGAARYLTRKGVGRGVVDRILGHNIPAVSATYVPEDWQHLRRIAGRLAL